MECHECIDPFNPRGHFVDKHKSRKMPKDYNQNLIPQLQRQFPYLTHNPSIPTDPIRPIFGLCEPKPDHQICQNCNRGFAGSDNNQKKSPSFTAHKCAPGKDNPPDRQFYISSVQRFRNIRTQTLFPVITADPPLPTLKSDPWISYQTRIASRPNPSTTISIPENYRVLHQFIKKERWLEHLEGKDVASLVPLVQFKSTDPTLPRLNKHIQAHMAYYQSRLDGSYPRRLISTRPS
jgi:hypothetical protein